MISLHDPFPCTSCGACCQKVEHVPELMEKGWVNHDGSCLHYDKRTKKCGIYEDRPMICRVDAIKPPLMHPKSWRLLNLYCCNVMHMEMYGVEQEQEGVCGHAPKEHVGAAGGESGSLDAQPEGSIPSASITLDPKVQEIIDRYEAREARRKR